MQKEKRASFLAVLKSPHNAAYSNNTPHKADQQAGLLCIFMSSLLFNPDEEEPKEISTKADFPRSIKGFICPVPEDCLL